LRQIGDALNEVSPERVKPDLHSVHVDSLSHAKHPVTLQALQTPVVDK